MYSHSSICTLLCVFIIVYITLSLSIYCRNNSDRLISIGLDLVTVMLECGGRSLGKVNSLRPLLQDGLCHHLLMVCNITR